MLQRLPNGLTVQGRVSAERERYHGKLLRLVNPDDVYRTDKTLTLQTSIWHKDIHWLGLTPKLTYRYSKNNSNLPALYSHNKQKFLFGAWSVVLTQLPKGRLRWLGVFNGFNLQS